MQTVIKFWDQIYFVEDHIVVEDSFLKSFSLKQINLTNCWAQMNSS